jgi:ankyrin repeat protein
MNKKLKQLNATYDTFKNVIKGDNLNAFKDYLKDFDFSSKNNKGQNIVQSIMDAYNFFIPVQCAYYLFSLEETKPYILELDNRGNNTIFQLFFQDCYDYNLIKLCLDLACDINQPKNATKESLLHYIVIHGSNDLFDLAIQYGANINSVCAQNYTVLHYALAHGKTEYIIQKVIETIDDNLINLKDQSGKTALAHLDERIENLEKNELNYKKYQKMLFLAKDILIKKIEKFELETILIKSEKQNQPINLKQKI